MRVFSLIKERFVYYLLGYIIGYVISLMYIGKYSLYYLMPVRIFGVIMAILVGNAMYYGSKKEPLFKNIMRPIKYIIFVVVLLIVSNLLQQAFRKRGIDITPFIGLPNNS